MIVLIRLWILQSNPDVVYEKYTSWAVERVSLTIYNTNYKICKFEISILNIIKNKFISFHVADTTATKMALCCGNMLPL